MLLIHKQYDELLHKCSDQEREIKELQAEVEALKSKVVCERQLKIDAQAEVERLQNQLDHISFESYTLTISQANKRLHSKVEDLQAEVERLKAIVLPIGEFFASGHRKTPEAYTAMTQAIVYYQQANRQEVEG